MGSLIKLRLRLQDCWWLEINQGGLVAVGGEDIFHGIVFQLDDLEGTAAVVGQATGDGAGAGLHEVIHVRAVA